MRTISTTELDDFSKCPRFYHHKNISKRVPIEKSEALVFGGLWHSIMEEWWKNGHETALAWLRENANRIDPVDFAKVAAHLHNYHPPRGNYEVINVETRKEVRIIDPATGKRLNKPLLLVKTDTILKDLVTGEKWILEHKTSGEEIKGYTPFWQRLAVDSQVGNYILALGAKGIIYDVVKKFGIRPAAVDRKRAEAEGCSETHAYMLRCIDVAAADLEAAYQWREVVKTEDDLREAQSDLFNKVVILRHCHATGMFPRNSNSCRLYNRPCDYLDVCTGQADLHDNAKFRDPMVSREAPPANLPALPI